ncbi:MAG: MarR family transcriptional regulator [Candidatus Hydrogenedentes bacterium]|nr:MarR family transcriptional regulator [Candidatus Hydrogenedentota bacterium]
MPANSDFRRLTVSAGALDEHSAPALVIGRTDQVEALWLQLKSSSARISAEPRVGKTWFLNLALALRPEWAGPTLFSARNCRSLREFVWELTKHLCQQGYVPKTWENYVREWYTEGLGLAAPVQDSTVPETWDAMLHRTCAVLMERGQADCPVIMVDELPAFLDTLMGEYAEQEAIGLLETLRDLRHRYPLLRMILSDAQGLQRVLDKLHARGYAGRPLEDMPPFELPPLTPADAAYLAGCLLMGEQVPCTNLRSVAEALARACANVPAAIRNSVDWMARFSDTPWTPERVASIPLTQFAETDDSSEPSGEDERLSPLTSDDLIERIKAGAQSPMQIQMEPVFDQSPVLPAEADAPAAEGASAPSVVSGLSSLPAPQAVLNPHPRSLEWLDRTLSPGHRAVAADIAAEFSRAAREGRSLCGLLAGPWGSGKSHVLVYVARLIEKRSATGRTGRRILLLPDAAPVPDSPFDLLLACVQQCGIPLEYIRATLDALEAEERFAALAGLFDEARAGQPVLVFVEQLDDALNTWTRSQVAGFQQFLADAANVSLLGTARIAPRETQLLHPWIADSFSVFSVPDPEVCDTRALLCALASARGDNALALALQEPRYQARVDAIHALTGGNCRLLALLDRCLSDPALRDLQEPLLHLVRGELSALHERRMADRSSQQQKILHALAGHQGRAVNVTELARFLFLTPQTVSRQLQELLRGGYVARTQVGRETCYELGDPLGRHVFELKQGRDSALASLVRVVSRWCSIARLHEKEVRGCVDAQAFRFDAYVEFECDVPESSAWPASIVDLTDRPGDNPDSGERALQCLPVESPEFRTCAGKDGQNEVRRLLDRERGARAALFGGARLAAENCPAAALACADRVLEAPDADADTRAMAAVNKSHALLALQQSAAAASWCAYAYQNHCEAEPAVRELSRVLLMLNESVALTRLDRCDEAARVAEEAVRTLGGSSCQHRDLYTAAAHVNRAIALERAGRFAESLAAWDAALDWDVRRSRVELRDLIATSRVGKALLQEQLGQHAAALESCHGALQARSAHPRARMWYALFTCARGNSGQTLAAVEAALGVTVPGQTERALLAAGLFERMDGREPLIHMAAAVFGKDRASLRDGLMLWLLRLLPLTPEHAERMPHRLHTLRVIFDEDPDASTVMNMADALARTALGDARACLDIPAELRALTAGV